MTRPGTTGDDWAKLDPRLAHLASRKNLSAPTPRKRKAAVPILVPLKAPERAGDVIVAWYPLPSADLQPNRKKDVNHFRLTKLTKATRDGARFITAPIAPNPAWEQARIDVTLWGKRLDRLNVFDYLKALLDGVADGLGMNDRHFVPGDIVQHTGKASGGRREVEIVVTRISDSSPPHDSH